MLIDLLQTHCAGHWTVPFIKRHWKPYQPPDYLPGVPESTGVAQAGGKGIRRRTWKRLSAIDGEGGHCSFCPSQISACSCLRLTVIYADFFCLFIFFPTHAKHSTHLSKSSLWKFVHHLECDFVLLLFFPAVEQCVTRTCTYYKVCRASDDCMLSSNECLKTTLVCAEVNRKHASQKDTLIGQRHTDVGVHSQTSWLDLEGNAGYC